MLLTKVLLRSTIGLLMLGMILLLGSTVEKTLVLRLGLTLLGLTLRLELEWVLL